MRLCYGPADSTRASRTTSGARLWVIGVAVVALVALAVAAGGRPRPRPHTPTPRPPPDAPPAPLTVVHTAPTGANVAGGSTISVQFSTDLAPGSPMPTLSPAVAGQWAALSPSLLQYQATGAAGPRRDRDHHGPRRPARRASARAASTWPPRSPVPSPLRPGSTLRLQQMLAELGYLPLNFTAAAPLTSPTQEGDDQVGTFTWRWADQPASLTSLWTPGTYNVITKGAVMNFESQHNLKTDGVAGPQVWARPA